MKELLEDLIVEGERRDERREASVLIFQEGQSVEEAFAVCGNRSGRFFEFIGGMGPHVWLATWGRELVFHLGSDAGAIGWVRRTEDWDLLGVSKTNPFDGSAATILPRREGVIRQRAMLFETDDMEFPSGPTDLLGELVELLHDRVIDETGA